MAKKFRGSSVKRENLIEMTGVSDLLKKIEAAEGRVDAAIKKAVDNSLEYVGMKMQLFMMEHKDTGDTYASYEQIMTSIQENKVEAMVGYNVDNGGLPAIFLDVGTPKRKPYFFRYYAIQNNTGTIQQIQRNTLEEILKGLI